MPRIPDDFLEFIVYIYPSSWEAREGQKVGGTGFLVSAPLPGVAGVAGGFDMTYLVTNSHVAAQGRALRLNTNDGGVGVLDIETASWFQHPDNDDLAVLPLLPPKERFRYKAWPCEHFITKTVITDLNVGLGDDIFFIGRLGSHDGNNVNVPVVRFGTIAMMPREPVFQRERGFMQESFLCEARSLGGFSGSPVILQIPPFSMRFEHGIFSAPDEPRRTFTMLLLGVDWGSLPTIIPSDATDKSKNDRPKSWESNAGIMCVVPAWKLMEMLDHPELHKQALVVLNERLG